MCTLSGEIMVSCLIIAHCKQTSNPTDFNVCLVLSFIKELVPYIHR